MVISGERVRQARELKGWTQSVLSKAVGVSQAAIAQVEAGAFIASDELVTAIALKTSQPLRFFQQEPPPEFPAGSLLFRAHASMTKRDVAVTYRHAQVAYELWSCLKKGLNPPAARIPQLKLDARSAAGESRRLFGIPAREPIPHLLNLLEWHGVVALIVPDIPTRDAFSLWYGELPLIALSSGRPGDRSRMNVAHELGHLVLHAGKTRLEVDESEADDFAAEFLMPESAMLEEIKSPVTISSLAALKPRWRVSIQALIYRSKELGIITDRQYRYLFEQISAMGWRKSEPVSIAIEKPRALRQMAELRFGNPIDFSAMAHESGLYGESLRKILENYAEGAVGQHPGIAQKVVTIARQKD